MSLNNRARETSQPLDGPVASDPGRRASGVQARAERSPEAPPAAVERDELPLISLGAPADPALLEPTYAYLSAYCFACLPPQQAQRLNVAIYELYANALRYGSDAGEVRLELRRQAGSISLLVSNYAEPAHLERLKAQLQRVLQDPSAAFTGEMTRFNGAGSEPMLGIVRVAHEVGLELELCSYRDRVEISTRCAP